jgi:hypothetical protein
MRRWLWFNSLSLAMFAAFLVFIVLQSVFGWQVRNEELTLAGHTADSYWHYLHTGHFGEAVFESWESEVPGPAWVSGVETARPEGS